jgi:hypothetical protein
VKPRAHVTIFALRHTRWFIVLFYAALIGAAVVLLWNRPWWFALVVAGLYFACLGYERVMGVVLYIRFEINRRVVREGVHPDIAEMEWLDQIRSFRRGQNQQSGEAQ